MNGLMEFLSIIAKDVNAPENLVKAYMELMLVSNPDTASKIKNATLEDMSFLSQQMQIDLSAIHALLNGAGSTNGEIKAGNNAAPMVALLEAKMVVDPLYDQTLRAFSVFDALITELVNKYTAQAEPRLMLAKDKMDLVIRYFESK